MLILIGGTTATYGGDGITGVVPRKETDTSGGHAGVQPGAGLPDLPQNTFIF